MKAPTTDDLLRLVDEYGCADSSAALSHALHSLADILGAACVQLLSFDTASGAVIDCQVSQPAWVDASRTYLDRWGKLDPRLQALLDLPPGEVMRCEEHFDANFVAEHEFFAKYLTPRGLRWTIAGSFAGTGDTTMVLYAMRSISSPPFDASAANTLGCLLPHFKRAWAISARLERYSAAVHSATDVLRLLTQADGPHRQGLADPLDPVASPGGTRRCL